MPKKSKQSHESGEQAHSAEGTGARMEGGLVVPTSREGESTEAVLDEEVQEESEETQEQAQEDELEREEIEAQGRGEIGAAQGQLAEGGMVIGGTAVDAEPFEAATAENLGVKFSRAERKVQKIGIIEAALFLANKPMSPAEIAVIAKCPVKQAKALLLELQAKYARGDGSISVDFYNEQARMQVRPEYADAVSELSREITISKKGLRILALIAKKGGLLQSDLRKYFRGEIYEYVSELKEQGYLVSEKHGNTRMLKPTKRFFEHFQVAGDEERAEGEAGGGQTKLEGPKA